MERIGNVEGQVAEGPDQHAKGEANKPKLSQKKEEQEDFQLLVDDLFYNYHPESALEEASVTMIARALLLKRHLLEFNSDTARLDQQIISALTQLRKSKSIRKLQESPRTPGFVINTYRKDRNWGLVRQRLPPQRRAQQLRLREVLQLLTPPSTARDAAPAERKPEDDPLFAPMQAYAKAARESQEKDAIARSARKSS